MTDTERTLAQDAAENKFNDYTEDAVTTAIDEENDGREPEASEGGEERNDPEIAPTDYEALAREDAKILASIFPSLRGIESVAELKNPLRYAALRDLGLTPKEAYLATCEPTAAYDNRSHLISTVRGKRGSAEVLMTHSELEAARELFSGLSDREIHSLYKKVTK